MYTYIVHVRSQHTTVPYWMAHKNWLIILLERNLGSILPIVCILLVRYYTSTLVNMCVMIMHTVFTCSAVAGWCCYRKLGRDPCQLASYPPSPGSRLRCRHSPQNTTVQLPRPLLIHRVSPPKITIDRIF